MLTEPKDLDRRALRAILAKGWDLRGVELEYVPVGFGSHHWRATDSQGGQRFVSVDDLQADFQVGPDADAAFAALERAFRTAATLRDIGLEFVLAPLPDAEGVVLRRLSDRYAVRVEPLVEGESSAYGEYEDAEERRRMAALLARLHSVTDRVPAGVARREDFAVPSRAVLVDALRDLGRPWDFGPFAEGTRRLLGANVDALDQRLEAYDELVARVVRGSGSWVITHGEPHRANVILDRSGDAHLVDWDTTLIAPRERDLQMVLDEDLTGWNEYASVAGVESIDTDALQLYRLWWALADIAVFVAGFRRPHERTEDTVASWKILVGNLQS